MPDSLTLEECEYHEAELRALGITGIWPIRLITQHKRVMGLLKKRHGLLAEDVHPSDWSHIACITCLNKEPCVVADCIRNWRRT